MRHAYLIIAHKVDYVFYSLIKTIDYPNNDIYILFDKKARIKQSDIKIEIQHSNFYLVPSIPIVWGGYSQIMAEIKLLSYASKKNYDYYHFMSGQDLCIKNQNYIQSFFQNNKRKIFISINTDEKWNELIKSRYEKYHIPIGKNCSRMFIFKKSTDNLLCFIQKMLHIKRHPKLKIIGGSNWCSIPNAFAKFILSKKDFIKKTFSFSLCSDELFIHTICYNSKYINDVYKPHNSKMPSSSCRLIDWNRGNKTSPRTFTEDDYDSIVKSPDLFARKFTYNEDNRLVDRILDYLHLNK